MSRTLHISAQRPARAVVAAHRLLAAPRFHARMVTMLATRRHFPEAADTLAGVAEPDPTRECRLPAILTTPMFDDVRLRRLALRFGFLDSETPARKRLKPVTRDALCRAKAKAKKAAARLVLAAAGERAWATASHRERAAYALNRLIAAQRGGVS